VIDYDCIVLIFVIMGRVLREANMKKWRVKSRPQHKSENIAKRLKWTIADKDSTRENFEVVTWSVECTVEKFKDPTPNSN